MPDPIEIQAPTGQPEVSQSAQSVAAPQGEPTLPEKFRGKPLEEIVKSYENLEAEHTRARQNLREKEQQLGIYQEALNSRPVIQQQPQYQPEPEEQVFRREWDQDPAVATYNQTQRALQKAAALNSQTASAMFYNSAKNDEKNYPGFQELETQMMEIARKNAHLINPSKLNSPEVIDLLYRQARAEKVNEDISRARVQGNMEAESRRREIKAAQFENPTPVSSSNTAFEDMTLEQMEKALPVHQR